MSSKVISDQASIHKTSSCIANEFNVSLIRGIMCYLFISEVAWSRFKHQQHIIYISKGFQNASSLSLLFITIPLGHFILLPLEGTAAVGMKVHNNRIII